MTLDDLISHVESLGLTAHKLTSRTINVEIDDASVAGRQAMLTPSNPKYLFKGIKGEFKYKGDVKGISSSAGALLTNDGFLIQLKPSKQVNTGHAGKSNEMNIMQAIAYTAERGSFTLVFSAPGYPSRVFQNITGVRDSSRDVGNKEGRNKADFKLINSSGREIPISLKQANAEFWGSEKSRYKEAFQKLIWNLIQKKRVQIKPHANNPNVGVITPEVAIKLSHHDAENVVFGDDILREKGCVVVQTFSGDHFDWNDKTKTLTVECAKVISKIDDLTEKDWPWMVVVNNASKKGIMQDFPKVGKAGIDIRAANRNRVHFNTAYVIDDEFDLEKV